MPSANKTKQITIDIKVNFQIRLMISPLTLIGVVGQVKVNEFVHTNKEPSGVSRK